MTDASRWQSYHNVLQIGLDVMAAESRRLNQAHDGRSPLGGAHAGGTQPVLAVMLNSA